MKKQILLAMAFAIAGLMIAGSMSTAVQIKEPEEKTVGTPIIITSMDATVSTITGAVPVVKKQMDTSSRGTDVLVHHDIDEEDCQNPALVTDASLSDILVFTEVYKDIGHTALWGRFSTDAGATWGDEIYGFDEIPEGDPDDVSVPKLDYYGEESWAYGTWTAGGGYEAQTYFLEMPSIVDPDYDPNGYGWVYYYSDWAVNHDFSDFDSADVACFPFDPAGSPSEDFWGIIAGTGDRPPGADEENDTMWFQYSIPGDSSVIWSFYGMDEDVSKMVTEIDISIRQPYLAMEYVMETDPLDTGSIFFKSPQLRPDNYPNDNWVQDGSFMGFYFDIYNPDIAAADGSVYVVGENADGNIVCLYSSDAGDSFLESTVSDDPDLEAFPQITISGVNLICAYTRDGDLYSKLSEDGGVTWINEEKVNEPDGTAVEQYGCTGIDGPYGSWTDNRDAPPTEIYFDFTVDLGDPPTAPIIDGDINGDVGTEYDYGFMSTDPDGDMIAEYIVNWGDGTGDETITGPFASGDRQEASHIWTGGGDFVITARAKDVNGLVGPDGSLTVTMPRSRTIDLPILKFLQNYPILFKIVQHLLGL